MKHIGLVCTTIGNGAFLKGYCDQIISEGLSNHVTVFVIADKKTPQDLYQEWVRFSAAGLDIRCPSLECQEDYLKRVNFNFVPWNSDNRRNVGYLMAVQDGCDVIISIDDDNFYFKGIYFAEHSIVGSDDTITTKNANHHWYSVCDDLGLASYPRGFPYSQINKRGHSETRQTWHIAVNQGLWIGEPDVDAITWLSYPKTSARPVDIKPFAIGRNTWMPINSQNTAVAREAMPTYYFIPMGCRMDRMGDIFQGYFLEACVKSMNQGIRAGTPVVAHKRNSHNHLQDALRELPGIIFLEEFLPWLTEVKLDGSTYSDKYLSLSAQLEDKVETMKLEDDMKAYWHRVSYCMSRWVKTVEVL